MRKQQYIEFLKKQTHPVDLKNMLGEKDFTLLKDHFGMKKFDRPAVFKVDENDVVIVDVAMKSQVVAKNNRSIDVISLTDTHRKGTYFMHDNSYWLALGDAIDPPDIQFETLEAYLNRCDTLSTQLHT